MLKVKRSEITGKHCSNWKAGICNTRNCGIECLRNGQKGTFFDQEGMDFKVDVAYLFNINGKKLGHIEIVQNITEEKRVQQSQSRLIGQIRDISEVFVAASSEMTSETEKNSNMATRAAKLAETIQANAEKGAVQMERMTRAVQEMGESSKAIGKVMSLINGITSQTNILSLNATVEAARAGEQGKSFAVVAEEVRNLAAKSTDSADTIAPLIQDSIAKAEQSVEIVRETSASLNEIVSGIQESVQLISEIAHSSEIQKTNISQINHSVDKMAQALENS